MEPRGNMENQWSDRIQQKKKIKHIELPAKPLDYFMRSNKSNINQTMSLDNLDSTVDPQHAEKKKYMANNIGLWQQPVSDIRRRHLGRAENCTGCSLTVLDETPNSHH